MTATNRVSVNRAAANQANAQHSTGPRTPAGKQRSSRNALRHGLTAASPVLPSEDRTAYEDHRRRFLDEYKPATPTESQFVQELADTSWRLNRIPLLEAQVEAELLVRTSHEEITFDIVDSHRLIANSKESKHLAGFQKPSCVRIVPGRQSPTANPGAYSAPPNGFVFSKSDVERVSQRLRDLNESRHFDHVLFHMQPAIPNRAGPANRLPPTALAGA